MHLARSRPVGRIATHFWFQLRQINEDVRLAAQVVGDHGGWVESVETTVTRSAEKPDGPAEMVRCVSRKTLKASMAC